MKNIFKVGQKKKWKLPKKLKVKRSFNLKFKLLASFLFICFIFSIGSGISYFNMQKSTQSYDYLINQVIEIRNITSEIESSVNQQSSHFRGYLLTEEESEMDQMTMINNHVSELVEEAMELSTLEETKQQLNALDTLNKSYLNTALQVRSMSSGRIDYANRNILPMENNLRGYAADLTVFLNEIVEERRVESEQETAMAMTLVLTISAAALIFAVIGGIFIATIITKPIIKIANMSKKLAAGDLTVEPLKIKSRDEIYDLNESFIEMSNNLRNMLSKIAMNTEQVAASSQQLTSSAEETSKATSTITESMQSVASGADTQMKSTDSAKQVVADMTESIQNISSSVEVVTNIANEAGEKSNNGVGVVEKAIKQMQAIDAKTSEISHVIKNLGDKSKQIDSIITLITDVAEQTNLLALNAAIEAARAGEHGRGFAVVADEVRKLAEQSNKSASEISSLIHVIQEDIDKSVSMMGQGRTSVEDGLTLVNNAGTEFKTISKSINGITDHIYHVLQAVKESTSDAETMRVYIEEASDIATDSASYAQNVAASAEEQMASMQEISASAETLSSMAEELQDEVSKFKI
ncbi:HAMP domain-containing methyl-accepting chemotaxis protein [Evansella cellulosilytica]|uniref:Methyl-accepting chemotaxis sensory transducer n=1 Tax=Evansella cellulosilytica (strain ATCC 21833 / DSM 2522 / FERM P-1141 / JCM 9156 / N-4) TaxID=649639 RepID=E6TR91_EVAC2|nr:methyl-accepting chemotaxis protein [Evansella cellulosilytica]ADU30603.1 methyl-accepting chemotaxis sensory transducer [Evansella cellulosilytica DSM 2522]